MRGLLSHYALHIQWNHLVKYFHLLGSNLETAVCLADARKPHCIHTALPCQLKAMQLTGNLSRVFPCLTQCVQGQAPAPTLLWPQMGLSVRRKRKNECQLQCGQLGTLQLTGRLTGWTTEPDQQKPQSMVGCVYVRLHRNRVGMGVIIYKALGAAGTQSQGNTKWKEIISKYPGVDGKSHNRYILDHKV